MVVSKTPLLAGRFEDKWGGFVRLGRWIPDGKQMGWCLRQRQQRKWSNQIPPITGSPPTSLTHFHFCSREPVTFKSCRRNDWSLCGAANSSFKRTWSLPSDIWLKCCPPKSIYRKNVCRFLEWMLCERISYYRPLFTNNMQFSMARKWSGILILIF